MGGGGGVGEDFRTITDNVNTNNRINKSQLNGPSLYRLNMIGPQS